MTIFSFSFIFVGSICFGLAGLHLLVFLRRQELKVDLFFSLTAFAISFSIFLEMWTFKVGTLTSYLTLFKSTICAQAVLWACFAWFIHFFTLSKRFWPPVLISVLYALALIINIFSPSGLLFNEITELTSYTMSSGEVLFAGTGPANPFRLIADIAWITLLIYTAEAFIDLARKGYKKKAIIFATTVFLCLGIGYLHGTLIDIGIAEPPYLGSILFLPLSMVMSFSLSSDVVSASLLSKEIRAAEARWSALLENVHLIVLGIDPDKTVSYVNPYFQQLTGYDGSDILNQPFVNVLPEKNREAIAVRLEEIISEKATILSERITPVLTKSGEHLKIQWSSVLLPKSGNLPTGIMSIGKDITGQEHAEAARDLAILELKVLKEKLEEENFSLKEMIGVENGFKEIVGESNGILYVLSKVLQVADTDATVLILGETGTGKELIAQAIRQASNRNRKPFIRVNCAAIPANLVESELFGHEPGSFTNADKLRHGKFELAAGGTIFLDEISEMPLDAQAKLLNVLQERELERVGGSQTIAVDVRVISATNRNLSVEVAEGRFRADLYYRLNIYPVTLPPLRNRKEDIPLLVKHFIALFNKQFGRNVVEVPVLIMETLTGYHWPGNVRELRNILERAVITCSGSTLILPDALKPTRMNDVNNTSHETEILPMEEVERQHILRTLQHSNWQINGLSGAAQILKMNPSTLRSRMKKHGLQKP